MAPKFGTSGLRGLVTELTPALVASYTRAFLAVCPHGGAVHVGQDLRASSPEIAQVVMDTVTGAGAEAVDHGALPTPALALAAARAGQAAIMVTGSHIPEDRNGLKFYSRTGEIGKAEEAAILQALEQDARAPAGTQGTCRQDASALAAYADRYADAFGAEALRGLRIGVYEHTSVARDVLCDVLARMGADVTRLGRAEAFIPVDTEAVDADTRTMLSAWCTEHALDALVSTDGDADRPMVTDETGRIVPGDVLGPLTARVLHADIICTPVSSNTLVDQMGVFDRIERTRIGSPFVIAAMEQTGQARVAGYEANGGFLLGYAAQGPAGPLAPLMTRDCVLPIVAPLAAAVAAGQSLSALVASLPPRFTAADRLQDIPTEAAQRFLAALQTDQDATAAFFADQPPEATRDTTDGLRITFKDGRIIHLRPSGNAPEFRCYTEAESADVAAALLQETLAKLAKTLRPA